MKYFIDNNISPKVARGLNCLVEPNHQVFHLKDRFEPDISDIEWMQKLSDEQELVILSGDTNISRNPHEVKAWMQAGHTIFFLKPAWMHLPRFEQAAKLFHIFPEIQKLSRKSKPGTGFIVPVRGLKIEEMK